MRKRLQKVAAALPLLVIAASIVLSPWHPPNASAGGDAARVRLQPTASTVNHGDGTFAIRVEVSGLNHQGRIPYDDTHDGTPDRFEHSNGMAAYEVKLRFDPNVIEVAEVSAGRILREGGREPQCFQQTPRRGEFALGCVSLGPREGVQGSGRLADITLRPLANGTTYLVLQGALSGPLGDPISAVFDGGIVRVTGAPTTAPNPDDPASNIPREDDPSGGSSADPPDTLDGSAPGDVSLADGNGGPGAGGTAAGDGTSGDGAPGVPGAGTGYTPPDPTWPYALAGVLAAAGLALLLFGARITLRRG